MKGLVPALLILPILAASLPAEPAEAADTYVMLGIDAMASGDSAASRRYLGAALELDANGSDAAYYLARAICETDIPGAMALLGRALANGHFARGRAADARLQLAALQVRVGRYEDALRTLDSLAPEDMGRTEPYRIEAAAELGLGRQQAALTAIEAGLRRAPTEASLHVLRARALRAGGFPVKDLMDIAAIIMPADPAIAAERALAAVREGGFRLQDYSVPSREDPRVFAEAFVASADAPLLARFFAAGGNQRVDLLVKVGEAAARSRPLRESYDAQVAGYTGDRVVDENDDGHPEEIYQYRAGALTSWVRDGNQDLVPEIRYEGGHLIAQGARFDFDPYPFLARASLTQSGVAWTFDLPPHRMLGPFIEGADSQGVARLRLIPDIPQAGTLAMAATAVSVPTGSSGKRTWTLEAGMPVGYAEDLDGDGKADSVLTYRGGSPFEGRRDIDFDGLFEVTERWSPRGLSLLQVDLNHNGVPEYTVDFDRRIWLWDYNEDGVPEVTAPAPDRGPLPDHLWPAIVPRRGEGR